MAQASPIEWTDATWNPIRGCSRVSEGCRNCYAEKVAARFSGPGQAYQELAHRVGGEARWTGRVMAVRDPTLSQPLRWRAPRKIFVNSMSDLFHEALPYREVDLVFSVMSAAQHHTYQVLTKRGHLMRQYIVGLAERRKDFACDVRLDNCPWPLPNVWLGVSVENRNALERVDGLRETPAAVRFLSAEPLLEDLGTVDLTGIHWVICGGESGHGARPMHPAWARSLRDQCAAAGVPFFFKQWGEWALHQPTAGGDLGGDVRAGRVTNVHPRSTGVEIFERSGRSTEHGSRYMARVGKKAAGRLLDGRTWDEFPRAA